jgi:hypothetical protein
MVALAVLVACVLSMVGYLIYHRPAVASPECAEVSLSWFLKGPLMKQLGGRGDTAGTALQAWRCAEAYHAESPAYTLAVLGALYVTLQAFAIPGPLLLSIIAGALYGPLRAQALVAVAATTGATCCYGISALLARPLLERLMPARLDEMRAKVGAPSSLLPLPRVSSTCCNHLR